MQACLWSLSQRQWEICGVRAAILILVQQNVVEQKELGHPQPGEPKRKTNNNNRNNERVTAGH